MSYISAAQAYLQWDNNHRKDPELSAAPPPPPATLNVVLSGGITNPGAENTSVSANNGTTWTNEIAGTGGTFRAFGFNGTTFYAVNGPAFYTSTDGITWTLQAGATGFDAQMSIARWNGSLWVAIAFNTNQIWTSTDGLHWTARTSPTQAGDVGLDVYYSTALSLWLYASDTFSPARTLATSPDGITWTLRTSPVTNAWGVIGSVGQINGVAYAGGSNAAVNGNNFYTSADGITWTATTLFAAVTIQPRRGAVGTTAAITLRGAGTTRGYYRSTDGTTWAAINLPLPPTPSTEVMVTYRNSTFILTYAQGVIYSSIDEGLTWTIVFQFPPMTTAWQNIA